jgi:TolB-like protein/Flp pilus assembly protein TadD
VGLASGTQIGPYEIAALLGAGGMGEVYRAVDTRLGREVAIKLLAGSDTDTGRLRRFEAETRMVGSLQHANILALYDVGNYQARPFLVSELLHGETLRDLLNRSALDRPKAVDLAIQLCRGLAAAHDRGVIHRDIKPENLFVTRDGVLKILDFGIAKRTNQNDAGSPRASATLTERTETGTILGTAGYMSPEQVRGQPADHRSDVFAVGSVLYEMLAGQPAFQRGSALESAYAVVKDQPPAMPDGVPADVTSIVLRCIEKSPEDRYQSARALGEALNQTRSSSHRVASGDTTPANVLSPARAVSVETSRKARVHRALRFAVLMMAIGGAGSWFGWRQLQQRSTPSRIMMAVLPFEVPSDDPQKEYLADGLTEGMISQLGRLSPERLAVIARTSVAQYRHTQKSIKEIAGELGVQYVLESSVQRNDNHVRVDARLIQVSDQTQVWAETYEREVSDVLQLQNDVAQAIAAQVRIKLGPEKTASLATARSLNPAAYEAYLRGSHFSTTLSADGIRQAISYFEQATKLDPQYAAAYARLARSLHALPIFTDTRPLDVAPRAKATALRALDLDDESAEAHLTLAIITLHFDWDWPGAEKHFLRALELEPNNAEAHRAYGNEYLRSVCRNRDAITELERSIELNPVSVLANYMLGSAYAEAGEFDKAVRQLGRAIELSPENQRAHLLLGEVYEEKGKYREAVTELEKAGGNSALDDVYVLTTLGRLQTLLGNGADGQTLLDRADAVARDSGAPVDYYAEHGRFDEAFAKLESFFNERLLGLTFLRTRGFEGLRKDPRYAALIQRVGIPEPRPGEHCR